VIYWRDGKAKIRGRSDERGRGRPVGYQAGVLGGADHTPRTDCQPLGVQETGQEIV